MRNSTENRLSGFIAAFSGEDHTTLNKSRNESTHGTYENRF